MIKDIYATWGYTDTRRHILAHITRSDNNKLNFIYNIQGLKNAYQDGLRHFVGFRKNADELSSERIEDILSLRVISEKRPDRMELLRFWEVPQTTDKIDVLAFTQGKSPTDFYEYIPDFTTYQKKTYTFVTDLVDVEGLRLNVENVSINDELSLYISSNEVKVSNKNGMIGKVKIIHELPFIAGVRANLTIKAIYSSSSFVKRIFVRVDVIDNTIRIPHFLEEKYKAMQFEMPTTFKKEYVV